MANRKFYDNTADVSQANPGTGDFILQGTAPPAGLAAFRIAKNKWANNDSIEYLAVDNADTTKYEYGYGTFTTSANHLTRSVTNSSNSDAAVNFTGTCNIYGVVSMDSLAAAVLTTAGDLLHHDGTTLARLAVGTNGQPLVLAAGLPAWAAVDNVQKFTSSGTWTKPSNGVLVRVICVGGGAGGGSGARGNNPSGGGGGGGGAVSAMDFLPSGLTSTVTVTIGAGGAGGANTGSNSDGNDGTAGGQSSFGSYLVAAGGSGGGKGLINAAGDGASGLGGLSGGRLGISITANRGGNGGSAPSNNAGSAAAKQIRLTGGGGGGGGGGSNNGGAGSDVVEEDATTILIAKGAGGSSAAGGAGSNGSGNIIYGAGGGGGGAGSGVCTGGSGGTAGAGGGGGGDTTVGASVNSLAGGAGARGEVWVITYFGPPAFAYL